MTRYRAPFRFGAFTLIELLVVIAIIAILAAILFPVFAQAKISAKITTNTSGMKQVALALHMYSTDADDMAVPEYGYGTPADSDPYHNHNTWVGRITPYVKNRDIFFDKLKNQPKGEDFADPFYPGYTYKWEWITNFSLNTDGYSRSWPGTGCADIKWPKASTQRSLTSFTDSASRLAVAPMRYANLEIGWMRFYGNDASWPTIDRYATGWSWYQLIWDGRREYPGPRFVGAFADGHAGKFGREKFVGYYADNPGGSEAQTYDQYCAAMDNKKLWDFWGRPWSGD